MIIPINISYSNLRTGKNFLIDIVSKLFEPMEENFKEELEIESNIVLNSKITIRILEPISTKKLLETLYTKDLNQEEIINSLSVKSVLYWYNQSRHFNWDKTLKIDITIDLPI